MSVNKINPITGAPEKIADLVQSYTLPTASLSYVGRIFEYVGADDAVNGFTNGYFYKCVEVEDSDPVEYTWANVPVQPVGADTIIDVSAVPVTGIENVIYRTTDAVSGETSYFAGNATEVETERLAKYDDIQIVQVETMPVASTDELNKVYQYIGETDSSYTKGFFYRCAVVPDTDPTEYEWVNQEVQESTDGEAKVNATAVTSLTGLADGFYLLIDSTATPIYQLKEIADGTATDSGKEVDTCLIDYALYNDNKTVLDTLDIVWVVTGTPDISDYKTEFETAKSGVRINADYTFEWDSDVFSVGNFADFRSQWNAFAVFMHNNKGRLAMITIDQYGFGFSDDDTGGSSPTLICIIPEIASTNEDYSIRIPYGSATSIHGDGYGSGFIDISWRLSVSSGKCDFAGINTTLFKGTDSMSTGYAYFGSSASSVYINEAEYSMNDPTEKAAAYDLYHQGVSIIVKLL